MATGRHAPFTAHKKGSVRAHGTISRVEIHRDGKTAQVTVRHTPPKKPKASGSKGGAMPVSSMDEMYPEETQATMPAAHASRFTPGQNVAVHIGPAEEIGNSEGDGGEESAAEDAAEAPGAEAAESKKGGAPKSGSFIRKVMNGKKTGK